MKRPRRTDSPRAIDRLLEHGWTVMLYDGDCNLCSGSVSFILRRSAGSLLAFCAMQSESGQEILRRRGWPTESYRTVLVMEGDGVLQEGEAVLRLMDHMGAPWCVTARMARRIPRPALDVLYSLFARNRYRLFGRTATCMLGAPGAARRFVR